MAFRPENQKIILNLDQIENLLGLSGGVEVVGLELIRDPPLLSVLLYNPNAHDPDRSMLGEEVPILVRGDQP